MKRISIFASILLISATCFGQMRKKRKAQPFDNIKEAKSYLDEQEKRGLFSGVILAIEGDKVILDEAYGMADMEEERPMNTHSKINLGSINKAFTAVSVMQLVDKGQLALEDKIRDYIPELDAEMSDEITIRHLLEMKSGYGSYWDSEQFLKNRKTLRNIEDYLPIIKEYKLNFKPGSSRQYSNSSYELLGILVQRVSGQNYYDYVRENIFKPTGMSDTDAYERDRDISNLAHGYTRHKPGEAIDMAAEIQGDHPYIHNVLERSPIRGTAAGGGYSTASDMKKFVEALTQNRLISTSSTDMVVNHFRNYDNRNNIYKARGGSLGVNAEIYHNSTKDLTIVVLANVDPPVASAVMNRLEATLDPKEDDPALARAQVEDILEAFKTCIREKNTEKFVSLFVDEARVSWVGNGSMGTQYSSPSAFMRLLNSSPRMYREDFHNVHINMDDRIATVSFDYGFFANDNLMNWGKESWFLIRQNDQWKINAVVYSMIMPHQKEYPY